MKVYTLVGKSGTGKSFQAINICRKRGIESIIDDGLFIYRGQFVAGKSAKKESTKIGAIKTAIFTENEHRDDVVKGIKKINPKSILVLGTSETMVSKIIDRLGLEDASEKIYIEDITSEEERRIATQNRQKQGKHVIPISSMQLKQQFSGYFLSPLQTFKNLTWKSHSTNEKTVVRPTYSYLGEFIISSRVISDIIKCTAKDIDGIADVAKVFTDNNIENLHVQVMVIVERGYNFFDVTKRLQGRAYDMIESMTAFNIDKLNIEVRGVI